MQQLIHNLMGEKHELGNRLYNIQPCLRSQDIAEVGDNRHTTFFEMMGNWSLGDYFKKEQLEWVLNYFTKIVGLDEKKLYITIFQGTEDVPKDTESHELWKKLGIHEERIFEYGTDHNWWSRFGEPSHMPDSEIGGPDSEVFYDFGEDLKIHEKSNFSKSKCHPNCECGRFLEIGNSVFMQYIKKNGQLQELSQKNVDYGGGLERISAATNNTPDVFKIDLFLPIINKIEEKSKKNYIGNEKAMRIAADHIKASVFLIANGVVPYEAKEQGSVLRKFMTNTIDALQELDVTYSIISYFAEEVINIYKDSYPDLLKYSDKIMHIISQEETRILQIEVKKEQKFKDLSQKSITIQGDDLFLLKQSFGMSLPSIIRAFDKPQYKNNKLDIQGFKKAELRHSELSRKSSKTKFGH